MAWETKTSRWLTALEQFIGEKTENNSIRESNNDTNQNNRTIENSDTIQDAIVELRCNIDDMTAEELSFAVEQIWQDDVVGRLHV